MRFVGIDLGWTSGATGLCCLEWADDRLQLRDSTRSLELTDILAWVDRWAPTGHSAIVAVDAPTVIPNPTGMRLADRLVHQHFGRYHAGAYPANQGLPFAERTVGFSQALMARGFQHGDVIAPQVPGRYQIELFPHAAMIGLFELSRIFKYKKGRLAERRPELAKLQQAIKAWLPRRSPAFNLDQAELLAEPIPTKGKDLKHLEDRLDALVCAYAAAHWWYWGVERNLVLGDRDAGYIVVPTPPPLRTPS